MAAGSMGGACTPAAVRAWKHRRMGVVDPGCGRLWSSPGADGAWGGLGRRCGCREPDCAKPDCGIVEMLALPFAGPPMRHSVSGCTLHSRPVGGAAGHRSLTHAEAEGCGCGAGLAWAGVGRGRWRGCGHKRRRGAPWQEHLQVWCGVLGWAVYVWGYAACGPSCYAMLGCEMRPRRCPSASEQHPCWPTLAAAPILAPTQPFRGPKGPKSVAVRDACCRRLAKLTFQPPAEHADANLSAHEPESDILPTIASRFQNQPPKHAMLMAPHAMLMAWMH
jgi:hypothetical protein